MLAQGFICLVPRIWSGHSTVLDVPLQMRTPRSRSEKESKRDVRSTVLGLPAGLGRCQVIILLATTTNAILVFGGVDLGGTVLLLLVMNRLDLGGKDVLARRSRRPWKSGSRLVRVAVEALGGVVEGLELIVVVCGQVVVVFLDEGKEEDQQRNTGDVGFIRTRCRNAVGENGGQKVGLEAQRLIE